MQIKIQVRNAKSYRSNMSSAPSPAPPPSTAARILEFILRQPIPDDLVYQILLALPLRFPLPARLSKLILLRRLSTDLSRRSLSPRTLYSLELIHQLSHPLPPSAPMRRAYCAVAVHCTLRHRRKNFPAAVDTIWNRRIGDLQRSDATGLAGEDVLCWRSVLEEAVENEELRRVLAERMTEDGALEALRAYLKHEMDAMGPPFLQLAAERFPSPAGGGEEPVGVPMNVDAPLINHNDIQGNENVTSVDMSATVACRKSCGRDTMHSVVDLTDLTELEGIGAGMAANDAHQSMTQDKFRGHEAANGNATYNHDKCSLSKLDRLPAQEVRRVTEALKSSSANLAIAVEDPLPDVLTIASIVIESRASEARNADEPQESRDQVDGKGPLGLANNIEEPQVNLSRIEVNDRVSAAETGTNVPHPECSGRETVCNTESVAVQLSRHSDPGPSDLKELEGNKDREAAAHEQCLGKGNDAAPRKGTGTILGEKKSCLVPRPSIMERNPTAHTFEWVEDSIDSSSESLPSPLEKRALPNFKRRDVSPLKLAEIKKINIQRKKKKWSLLEEHTLRQAVEKYGVGNWKYILSSYNEIFEDRIPGDLKDKWRNMTKH